jgi:hypothetical protein
MHQPLEVYNLLDMRLNNCNFDLHNLFHSRQIRFDKRFGKKFHPNIFRLGKMELVKDLA